jgi:UPF0716 protein FxsA
MVPAGPTVPSPPNCSAPSTERRGITGDDVGGDRSRRVAFSAVFFVILVLLIAIPIIEIYVMVQVAQEIGILFMIGLLIAVSVVGTWIARTEGFLALNRIRRQVLDRQVPDDALIDGGIILAAGLLLLVPGFVSDLMGIVLLLPPIRIALRSYLKRRWKITVHNPLSPPRRGPDDVIDV